MGWDKLAGTGVATAQKFVQLVGILNESQSCEILRKYPTYCCSRYAASVDGNFNRVQAMILCLAAADCQQPPLSGAGA